jgi:hypothetical protein
MATVESAARMSEANKARQAEHAEEVVAVYLELQKKSQDDLLRIMADIIVQLRHHRSCSHDVRY